VSDGPGPEPTPARDGRLGVVRCLRTALGHFIADEGLVLAGHLSFIGLLSLFPFVIFLFALAGFFGQTETGTQIVALLLENLPDSVSGALEGPIIEVMQETRGGLLTVGIVAAIWTASTGLEGIRKALNRAFDVTAPRRYWRRRLESIVIVIAASAIIIAGMSSLVLGELLWEELRDLLALPTLGKPVWTLFRYGISATLLFCAVAALYWILPARRLKLGWIVPGAALVLGLWLLAGSLFTLYLEHFNRYALTYGSLGGVVIALLFFYILGAIFIFGAEVNAVIAGTRVLDAAGSPQRTSRKRGSAGF